MSIWAKTWAYSKHPKRIDDDGNVTDRKHPAAKAVLVALAEYPGPGQRQCWPSQTTIADMTDYTDRQVRTCMSDLEAQGLIRRSERRRKDGTRRSDMVELLGPIEAFGPPQDSDVPDGPQGDAQGENQPEESSARSPRTNRKRVPHQPEESSGHEPPQRTAKGQNTSLTNVREVAGEPAAADVFVSFLSEELDGSDIPYTAGWRGRHGKQFKEHARKGVPESSLYKACDRIVERWTGERHAKLSVENALADVLNGSPPRHAESVSGGDTHASTPQTVIDYVFENTKTEVIRNQESSIRRALAKHDFTSGGEPSYPVRKLLGGTDNEQWQVQDALESLCRRALRAQGDSTSDSTSGESDAA